MERRRFLALCAASGGVLAGCTDSRDEASDGASQSGEPSPLDGAWNSYQGDAANTGGTDDPGPTDDAVDRWTRATTPGPPAATPATADGAFVVVTESGAVYARDAADGGVRWTAAQSASPTVSPVASGRTAVVADGRILRALGADDGEERWTATGSSPRRPPGFAPCRSRTARPGGATRRPTRPRRPPPSTAAEGDGTRTPYPTDTEWFAAGVRALSPADGSDRWRVSTTERYNFTSGPPDELPLLVADGHLVVGLGGTLRAYDATTGEALWTAGGGGVAPATTDGVVSTGAVGVGLADGAVAWRFGTATGVSPAAVVGNDLYVGSDDHSLYALAANAGAVRWSARTDGRIRATPAVGSDAVYAGTLDGAVYALDRADGSERWVVDVGGQVRSPTLREGTLYVGDFSPTVTALDAADGTLEWRTDATDAGGTGFVALELAATDDAVYGGANGDLRAFDADDGHRRWRVTADSQPTVQSSPAVGAGDVLVNVGESVRAYDPADGTERWTGDTGGSHRPPVVHEGTVYAPGEDAVYAFDAADGTRQWRAGVGSDLALTVGDETLYAVGHETPLVALDAADGSVRWRSDVGATTPVAVADDFAFVGDEAGTVHAVGPTPE